MNDVSIDPEEFFRFHCNICKSADATHEWSVALETADKIGRMEVEFFEETIRSYCKSATSMHALRPLLKKFDLILLTAVAVHFTEIARALLAWVC